MHDLVHETAALTNESTDALNNTMPTNGKPKMTAAYDYRNAKGALVFQVCRFEPGLVGESKTFRQRIPDGKGGWKWGLHGTPTVLYRLPELLASDGIAWIVEGEKDVDRLAALGLTATCNPMGAGKWQPAYSESLRGRHVIIIPDNDEPGRKHGELIRRALRGIAAGNTIILPLPDLPEKGDVSDWLDAGGDKASLALLAERAIAAEDARTAGQQAENVDADPLPDNEGNQHREDSPPPGAGSGFRFEPVDSATFAQADYRPSWLVRRLLVQGQPAIVGGPKKALKTSLIIDLALSIANGIPFLGEFTIPTPARVAVLSGESGEHTLQETAFRVCKAKGVNLAGADVLWEFRLPQLANLADMGALADGLVARQVRVLLLDPLYLCLLASVNHGLNPASMYDMGPLFAQVSRACLTRGCTPVLVHHFRQSRGANYDEPQLEDLAFAGIQEFARQWLLVGRREKYEPGTGQHRLWLSAGGSIGHGGVWAVDINEGTLDDDFRGRSWEVTVTTAGEENKIRDTKRREQKQRSEHELQDAEENKVLTALDGLSKDKAGVSFTTVRDSCGIGKTKVPAVFLRLKQKGIVEEIPVMVQAGKGLRQVKGLRRIVE